MAAPVGGLQQEGDIGLLAGFDSEIGAAALAQLAAVSVRIDHKSGVDQVAAPAQQEVDAILLQAHLLVGGEGGDDVPVGDEALLLQPHQTGQDGGVRSLHVRGPAPVEVAILLGQREGGQRPVIGLGLDDIQMPDPQDRLAQALAAQAGHDIDLVRVHGIGRHLQIPAGEAGGLQPGRDHPGRVHRSGGVNRMDSHQVAEDAAGQALIGRRRRGPRLWRGRGWQGRKRRKQRRQDARPSQGPTYPDYDAAAGLMARLARRVSDHPRAGPRILSIEANAARVTDGRTLLGGGGPNQAERTPIWRARFSLDMEPLGPVHAEVALMGERAGVTLWAERPDSLAILSEQRGELTQALKEADFTPEVALHAGAPHRPAPPAGRFVDQAT